jgi:CopG family transcriptional regulator, nickel-responsive regulator
MERITMSIDETLAQEFDALIARRGYTGRSEAMRDLLRREIEADRATSATGGQCVANFSYVYNHHQRDLTERLTEAQHAHHDLVVAAMHVHLDHDHCLESVILKGRTDTVRAFAQRVGAERGVRHGHLNLIGVEADDRHRGFKARTHSGHAHLRPRT